jgi:hypothetical protein
MDSAHRPDRQAGVGEAQDEMRVTARVVRIILDDLPLEGAWNDVDNGADATVPHSPTIAPRFTSLRL